MWKRFVMRSLRDFRKVEPMDLVPHNFQTGLAQMPPQSTNREVSNDPAFFQYLQVFPYVKVSFGLFTIGEGIESKGASLETVSFS
jgi:hypothetical protein